MITYKNLISDLKMNQNGYMIELDQQPQPYSIRLPASVRKQLEESAKLSGRSLHAEILLRLSNSLEQPKSDSVETPPELKIMMRHIALEVVREELSKAGLAAIKNAG